jgi:positive regulator of sigma E activity
MFFEKSTKILTALTSVTQASLCMIVPAALCIGIGKWLVDKAGFPHFTMVAAIVLGVISGFYSMFKYIIQLVKLNDNRKNCKK